MGSLIPVKITSSIGTIQDNLDMVEASIREKVEEYKKTVVTEDTIKDNKQFLAYIRKEKQSLDNERKSIKKAWMVPYEDFEKRVKNIISLYDEPVDAINMQLEEYDRKRREEKRVEIENIYNAVKGDMEEWLPFDRIYNPKWENATYSNKKIRSDMEALFGSIKVSVSTIKSASSEFEEEGLAVLKKTGDLQAAFEEMNTRKRIKEEIAAKEERKCQEERQKNKEQEILEKQIPAEEAATGKQLENIESIVQKPETEKAAIQENSIQSQDVLMPFTPEKEVVVQVYIRESSLGWFKGLMEEKFIRYEVK
ncbi:MAG: DUF1351 domain-containing protein [Lachnospiraceae bacterium]|jgi:Protein of unknown function (DUF1351).